MRRVYAAALICQYVIWGLYLASIIGIYLLGFIVDTLATRWLLITGTEIVVVLSVILSVTVSGMFIMRLVRGEAAMKGWLGLGGALPSLLIVCATFFYFLERFF